MKSMFLSLTALIVAALALINSVCGLQDSNLVISFLGVLVTLLVGWNIIQFIFAEKRMEEIAQKAAKAVESDLVLIFKGQTLVSKAKSASLIVEKLKNIDLIFQALECYSNCEIPSLVAPSLEDALLSLKGDFEYLREKNLLHVLEGKKASYEYILQGLQGRYLQACSALLSAAEEILEEDYKQKIPKEELEGIHLH